MDSAQAAQYVSTRICNVIESVAVEKIVAVVKASDMKAAWKEEYSCIISLRFSAHGLNLLANDTAPVEPLKKPKEDAKRIIPYMKRTHVVAGTFKEKRDTFPAALKLSSKTRWGAIVLCFENVMQNKKPLQETVIAECCVSKPIRGAAAQLFKVVGADL